MEKTLLFILVMALFLGCNTDTTTPEQSQEQQASAYKQSENEQNQRSQEIYTLLNAHDYPAAQAKAKDVLLKFPNDWKASEVLQYLAVVPAGPATADEVLSNRMIVGTDKFTGVSYYNHKFFDSAFDLILRDENDRRCPVRS